MADDIALAGDAAALFERLCAERGIAVDDVVYRALAARAAQALTDATIPAATLTALLTLLPEPVTAQPADDYNLALLNHRELKMLDWLTRKASGIVEERPQRNMRRYHALSLASELDRLEYFAKRDPDDDSHTIWNALFNVFHGAFATPEHALAPMLRRMGWLSPADAEALQTRVTALEDAALKAPAAMPPAVPASMPANVTPLRPRSIHDYANAPVKPGAPGSWLP